MRNAHGAFFTIPGPWYDFGVLVCAIVDRSEVAIYIPGYQLPDQESEDIPKRRGMKCFIANRQSR